MKACHGTLVTKKNGACHVTHMNVRHVTHSQVHVT